MEHVFCFLEHGRRDLPIIRVEKVDLNRPCALRETFDARRLVAIWHIEISIRIARMRNVRGIFETDMICCSVIILILRVTLFYHEDQHFWGGIFRGSHEVARQVYKTYVGHDINLRDWNRERA